MGGEDGSGAGSGRRAEKLWWAMPPFSLANLRTPESRGVNDCGARSNIEIALSAASRQCGIQAARAAHRALRVRSGGAEYMSPRTSRFSSARPWWRRYSRRRATWSASWASMMASTCGRRTANAKQANFGEAWQIGQNAGSELTSRCFRSEGRAKAWEMPLGRPGSNPHSGSPMCIHHSEPIYGYAHKAVAIGFAYTACHFARDTRNL